MAPQVDLTSRTDYIKELAVKIDGSEICKLDTYTCTSQTTIMARRSHANEAIVTGLAQVPAKFLEKPLRIVGEGGKCFSKLRKILEKVYALAYEELREIPAALQRVPGTLAIHGRYFLDLTSKKEGRGPAQTKSKQAKEKVPCSGTQLCYRRRLVRTRRLCWPALCMHTRQFPNAETQCRRVRVVRNRWCGLAGAGKGRCSNALCGVVACTSVIDDTPRTKRPSNVDEGQTFLVF